MVNGVQNQEGVSENLRKQLAVAVRSIQWSYIIFWSFSTSNEGVLKWGDGYYNGDIKTRKIFETVERLEPGKMGLQRSEQLKELYESLLVEGEYESESENENEDELQLNLPSPALSPEDLSDAEWYYMVCMSFVFNQGQDLAGRALEMNQAVWLADAQYADNEVFSRSLLAKSASIQTIVCFPYLGGVIELGVNDLVLEDPSIVQHVKASLLDFSKPVCSENSSSNHNEDGDDDDDPVCALVNYHVKEDKFHAKNNVTKDCDQIKVFDMDSPDGFSNNETSQAQSFMDDDCSNGCVQSMTSSDCMSQVTDEDLHYKRIISTLLGTSYRLAGSTLRQGCNHKSSFVSWKRTVADVYVNKRWVKQGLLKKILFTVPLMHGVKDQIPNVDKKIMVLKSMVPCISKIDKGAILIDTIKYVKELEARLEELESTIIDKEAINNKKPEDGKKSWLNKRKACEIDEMEDPEMSSDAVIKGDDHLPWDMKVSIKGQEVSIELQCSWREYLLLEIIDAINNMQLDAQSIQSSIDIGVFTLAVTSKFRGAAFISAGKIKQELLKVTGKC